MLQRLKLRDPDVGGLGLISGQGTRSYMQQLRAHMLQLKRPLMLQLSSGIAK